jgi:hypothetical protein
VFRQERLLLDRRPAVGAADAGEHGRDMAVPAVEGQGALGEVPGERREARRSIVATVRGRPPAPLPPEASATR